MAFDFINTALTNVTSVTVLGVPFLGTGGQAAWLGAAATGSTFTGMTAVLSGSHGPLVSSSLGNSNKLYVINGLIVSASA